MDKIDLRSDTVTHPTPEMREAMANAAVGDDVYGDDPTVNQLEADAAKMLGKEAALFVTSGTQGNLCALLAHCQRGDEIIIGNTSHIFRYEQGGMAQFGGISPHTIPVQADGTLRLEDIEAAIRDENEHYPITRMVALENTHNMAGGVSISADYINQVAELTHKHGLILHLDGARIFNATTALNVDIADMLKNVDSVTFCLSKGLCAPAGSILVGSADFIRRARRARKALGGGLRQAGILAAAGLISLHQMTKRLQVDHDNAQLLAEGLSEIPHITVKSQHTNFVFMTLEDSAPVSPSELIQTLRDDHNILLSGYQSKNNHVRLVTHYWIDRQAVETVIAAMKTILS
jgi:threonine aldolase